MASRGPVLLQHHGGYREWWYRCIFGGGGVIGGGKKTEMVCFFSCKYNKWHPLHFCPCTVFLLLPLEIVTWGLLDPCQLLGTTGSRARKGVARLPTRRSPLGDLGMLLFVKQWWWEVLSRACWWPVHSSWDQGSPMFSRWFCLQLTNLFCLGLDHFKSYWISLLDFVCLRSCSVWVASSVKFSVLGCFSISM